LLGLKRYIKKQHEESVNLISSLNAFFLLYQLSKNEPAKSTRNINSFDNKTINMADYQLVNSKGIDKK